ncbi:restriction endonuclease subunit S [Aquiflexum sp.]|uniref:restriction endonuclease subunit S n=1 Tax=Aquiflexum sp. TaxID=1872584 RepID=UPI0035935C46
MKMVKIGNCCKVVSGATPKREVKEFWKNGNFNWFTPKDLSGISSKYIENSPEKISELGLKSCSAQLIPPNSLLLSSRAPIGHLAINLTETSTNQGFKSLVPGKQIDVEYLYYAIKKIVPYLQDIGNGATFKELSKSKVENVLIPLPALPTQQKIAAVLDKADAIRKRSQQILVKYDQLAQSVFLDMFGDPVKNEKGWEVKPLGIFGSFKNGLNYSKDDSGFEIKCIGVGDFKSKYQIDDFMGLSSISISALPSKDFLLKDGDLVFVRSNGNQELVGRCVAVYPKSETVSFSGFCIRFRLGSNDLSTVYLTQLFRNSRFKKAMLNGGRGANIQNINQQILSNLKINVPPFNLQNQFASIISQIEKQKAQTQLELNRAEELYQSLLQRAFTGELFPEPKQKELTVAP